MAADNALRVDAMRIRAACFYPTPPRQTYLSGVLLRLCCIALVNRDGIRASFELQLQIPQDGLIVVPATKTK